MYAKSSFQITPNKLKIRKMTKSQFDKMTYHQIFSSHYVSLVNFSYWSKLYANIITGSGVMAAYVYKGLARNQEIKNIPI